MFSNLFRVGKDTELRYTPSGKAVCNVALAYDIGFGDKKRTGWIEAVLWEKRAEKLAQYLTKGKQVFAIIDDVEIEPWESNGKSGAKLKGRIVDIKLAGDRNSEDKPAPQAAAQPAQQPVADQQTGGFDDFDTDVPF
jgi:single-strand DNA-binding protein